MTYNVAIEDLKNNPWGPEDQEYGLSGRAAQEEYWLRALRADGDSKTRVLTELEEYLGIRPMKTNPNTIPDDVADAAQIEHYEFVFGEDAEPLTRRELVISRQAWKCAIAVALDKMKSE